MNSSEFIPGYKNVWISTLLFVSMLWFLIRNKNIFTSWRVSNLRISIACAFRKIFPSEHVGVNVIFCVVVSATNLDQFVIYNV